MWQDGVFRASPVIAPGLAHHRRSRQLVVQLSLSNPSLLPLLPVVVPLRYVHSVDTSPEAIKSAQILD